MRKNISNLAGLRGYAALLVMFYHFGGQNFAQSRFVINHGWMAVDLFFILSGFVLSYAYGEEFIKSVSRRRYFWFIWRRIARLYPAYWVASILALIKIVVDVSGKGTLAQMGPFDFVGNFVMATGWGIGVHPILGVSWSVSSEIAAYVLFPFVAFAVMGAGNTAIRYLAVFLTGAAMIFATSLSNLGANGSLDIVSETTAWPIIRCVGGFLIGIGIYGAYTVPAIRRAGDGSVIVGLALLGCIVAIVWAQSDLVVYVWLPPVVLLLTGESGLGEAIFSNRFSIWIGEISYSVYLLHTLFHNPTQRIAALAAHRLGFNIYPVVAIAAMSVVLAASTISYHLFEVRAKNWMLSLYGRKTTAAALES